MDNSLLNLHNSSHHAQPLSIVTYYILSSRLRKTVSYTHKRTHVCGWPNYPAVRSQHLSKIAWVFHVPQESVKSCETRPTVFRWKAPTEISFSSELKNKGCFCWRDTGVNVGWEKVIKSRNHTKTVCDLFLDFFILSLLIEPAVILRCTGIWKRVLLLAHHLRTISLSSRLIRFPFRKYVYRR